MAPVNEPPVHEPRVREPRPDDAEDMARVHVRAWQAGYAGTFPDAFLSGLGARLDERISFWRSQVDRTAGGVLVATFEDDEQDEAAAASQEAPASQEVPQDRAYAGPNANLVGPPRHVVGICSFGAPRDTVPEGTGELHMLNVDPTAWGTGVADALFEAALARLAERYASAYLWVLDGNERAQRFYRRHGWAPDGSSRVEEVGGAQVREVIYAVGLGRRA